MVLLRALAFVARESYTLKAPSSFAVCCLPARTNCWVDPTLCLVIRSDKRTTLRGSRWVAVWSQQGYPSGSPTAGTPFGCGPKAPQPILHSATR
jgi:hypothetical protein